eukprot:COSAG02_NODE_495_length_21151_cov_31.954256_19_plen_59_part_00
MRRPRTTFNAPAGAPPRRARARAPSLYTVELSRTVVGGLIAQGAGVAGLPRPSGGVGC